MDDFDNDNDDDDFEDETWLDDDWSDEAVGVGRVPSEAERAACRRRARHAREKWRHLPDEPDPEPLAVEAGSLGTVLRALRWRARQSQRELAVAAGVPLSTLIRLESGSSADARVSSLQRIVEACGLRLAVVDDDGTLLAVPFGQNTFRDAADRMLPAHLPNYDPRGRDWWGHGLVGGPDPRHPEPPRVHTRRERPPRPRTGPRTTLSDDDQERSA